MDTLTLDTITQILSTATLAPLEVAVAKCGWCSGPLPPLKKRWCSEECLTQGEKILARKRNKNDHNTKRCTICGVSLAGTRRVTYCGESCYRVGQSKIVEEHRKRKTEKERLNKLCEGCEIPLPKFRKLYCDQCKQDRERERHRELRAIARAARQRETGKARSSVSVGDCRWCQALSSEREVFFPEGEEGGSKGGECKNCYDSRKKATCQKCQGPTSQKYGCIRCEPAPEGCIDVILINDSDQRERIVRRPVLNGSRKGLKGKNGVRQGDRKGKIKIWKYLFFPREGLTVELPVDAWVTEGTWRG